MRLVALEIERLPGIRPGFRLGQDELGADFVWVHGPNGIGKSAVVRALRALLWPATSDAGDLDLAATFVEDGNRWRVERRAARVQWTRDGERAERPPLPAAHVAACYTITIDDLFTQDRQGTWFAQQVALELSGGYDLDGVAQRFQLGRDFGAREAREWEKAKTVWQQRSRELERLAREEGRLSDLARQIESERAAAARLSHLESEQELRSARARADELASTLAAFPAGMKLLRADERERAESRARELDAARQRLTELERGLAHARARLQGCAGARRIESGELEELAAARERVERLRTQENKLAVAREECAAARAALDVARASFGPQADLERLAQLEPVDLRDIEDVLRQSSELESAQAARAARVARLPGPPDPDVLERTSQAARALAAWLRSPPRATWSARRLAGAIVVAVLGAASILALGLLVHPAWLGLLPLFVIAGVLAYGPGRGAESGRDACAREFERSRLPGPTAWSTAAVETRLEELERERASLRAAARDGALRDEAQAALEEGQLERERLERARAKLAQRLGLAARDVRSESDLALLDFAAALATLRRAREELARGSARVEELERERAGEARRVAQFLHAPAKGASSSGRIFPIHHGPAPAEAELEDAAALAQGLRRLEEGARQRAEAEREVEIAQAAFVEQGERVATLASAHARAFTELGLEPGDERALAHWCEQRDRFLDHERERAGIEFRIRALEASLQGAPDLAALDEVGLAARLQSARGASERGRELELAARDVTVRVAQARERGELEAAAATLEEARAALERARDAQFLARAGELACADVEREHAEASRPAVLERARALFSAFTRGALALEVVSKDGQRRLVAIESARPDARVELEALSTGTRAQLLLAARLAFAAQAERGLRLPIVLDDALSVSDPQRTADILTALQVLIEREGRQVLVLAPDVPAAALPQVGARLVDLARVRRGQAAVADVSSLTPPRAAALPSSQGLTAAQYAQRVGVPRLDPFQPLEDLHLHYVCPDDAARLERLLRLRVERVGPLRRLAATASVAIAPADVAAVERGARLAGSVIEAWRVGRGARVDRAALERSGVVSQNYLDGFAELARECGGDALEFLTVLDARQDARTLRFQKSKESELREFLLAEGYLDPAPRLTREEAWLRVLATGAAPDLEDEAGAQAVRRAFEFLWARCDEADPLAGARP